MLLTRTATSNNFKASTFTLPLSEGQADETWEPSNRIMPFTLKNKMSLASPLLSLPYVSPHITLLWHVYSRTHAHMHFLA